MKDYPAVLVEWVDSSSFGAWKTEEEHLRQIDGDDLKCRSAGFLVRRDERVVILAQSQSGDGKIADLLVIPVVAVVAVGDLRVE